MEKFSLDATAHAQLQAAVAGNGHAATTLYGGHEHVLRQTVMGLRAGSATSEHEYPGEATVQVLAGRVRLNAGGESWDGRRGDLLVVPRQRHSLSALEDSAVLLTVAKPRFTAEDVEVA
jgi:quercetin dioxygenase-like cupin family protein